MQLTLSMGSVSKAPFQSHNLHEHPHWDAQCCQLAQLSSAQSSYQARVRWTLALDPCGVWVVAG